MSAPPPFPPIAERHEESRRRYRARDLQGYMSFFAPDLSYRQANGQTVNFAQLSAQVATQLRNMSAADWTARVDSEERDGDRITETVTQNGTYVATAFGFLHRTWRFERRAKYTWKVHEGAWRIASVEVVEERMTDEGIRFGRK
jgi:hypothetical protein